MKVHVTFKGGPGSGHFGHSGREGFVGGSDPGSGSGGKDPIADRNAKHKFSAAAEASELIGIGYEQSDASEGQYVDFGDALRIFTERNPGSVFDETSIKYLYGEWYREFKHSFDIASEIPASDMKYYVTE